MIAIEVTINDEPAFTAGIADLGAVSAILTTALRDAKDGLGAQRETSFHVDGRHAETEELRSWVRRGLTVGDKVEMRIVDVTSASEPESVEKIDPEFLEKQRRKHYEALKKKYEPAAIDHTGVGVSDVRRSALFYDAALGALGIRRVNEMPDDGGIAYGHSYPEFWIDRYHRHDAKHHTAFRAKTRAEVVAFYEAALKAGGTDNGAPGLRPEPYPPGYFAAFVLDPDGNNIEAVLREA